MILLFRTSIKILPALGLIPLWAVVLGPSDLVAFAAVVLTGRPPLELSLVGLIVVALFPVVVPMSLGIKMKVIFIKSVFGLAFPA